MSALLDYEMHYVDQPFPQPVPVVRWESVMSQQEKRLINFIRKRVANYADVEDLVQSTWLEVLKNKHKYSGASRPETWVFGIALNLVRNYYKSRATSFLHDELSDELLSQLPCHDKPDDLTAGHRTLTKVLSVVAHLPEESQQMLQLIVDGYISYQEVALELAIPIGTVRSRLSRLRQSLRNELDPDIAF